MRRGSAVIGTLDSAFGVGIEEGDILTVPTAPGLPPAIAIAAETIGLGTIRSGTQGPYAFGDDLDALDLASELPSAPNVPSMELAGHTALAALLLGTALVGSRRRHLGPAGVIGR